MEGLNDDGGLCHSCNGKGFPSKEGFPSWFTVNVSQISETDSMENLLKHQPSLEVPPGYFHLIEFGLF